MLIGRLKRFQRGRFTGLLTGAQQFGIQAHPQGLLIAGKPNAGPTVSTLALNFHAVQFVLERLCVLLNLLCLLEGFGELAEIG